MVSAHLALVEFLNVAALLLCVGTIAAFSLSRRVGNLRGLVVLVFLLSVCAGALAARVDYDRPQPEPREIVYTWIVATWFPCFGDSLRRVRSGQRAMGPPGPLLYTFPRPGNFELTWSGRAALLMSSVFFLLQRPAVSGGWLGATMGWSEALVLGWMGFAIAKNLGRVELREGGILRWGVFYPWANLGKFEWMPDNPPILRIQVRRGRPDIHRGNDIRIDCPDNAEINAILTTHGLIRW